MATTSSAESDFSRLHLAKTDFRSKLICLAMKEFIQAGVIIAIARKIAVPFDFLGW
jgi:hypothetical protein